MFHSSVEPTTGNSETGSAHLWPFNVTICGPLGPAISYKVNTLLLHGDLSLGTGSHLNFSGSSGGIVMSSLCWTVNCIIWPVVSLSGASPVGYGAFASLFRMILVPAGISVKSTSISARSPGEIRSDVRGTGLLR